MKIKIKTWDKMESEYGLDIDGDINVFDIDAPYFTIELESILPKDRIIDVEPSNDNLIWRTDIYSWTIAKYMIESYIGEDYINEGYMIEDDEYEGTVLLDVITKSLIINKQNTSTKNIKRALEENGVNVTHVFSCDFVKDLNENQCLITVKYC